MGQMTTRTLVTILGVCTLVLGAVGLSETINPSKTALGTASLAIRLFAPILLTVGVALFVASRRISRRLKPSPLALTITGAASVMAPAVIWVAGALAAPQDGAIWAPMVAVAAMLLALPGFGMCFGGLRRMREPRPEPRPTAPATKVRRRK